MFKVLSVGGRETRVGMSVCHRESRQCRLHAVSVVAGLGSADTPPKSWCNPCRTSLLRSQLHCQHSPPRRAASCRFRAYSRGRKQQASRRRADASPLSNSQALRSGEKRDGESMGVDIPAIGTRCQLHPLPRRAASRKVRNVLSRAQAVVVAMGAAIGQKRDGV
ncbi:hypothetical protein B0H34DRAFT_857933 [Crassisporium funariophilum]|nr:hypothetical protein B0H34DRAFT_857933 [Crassisporium funariophilum]